MKNYHVLDIYPFRAYNPNGNIYKLVRDANYKSQFVTTWEAVLNAILGLSGMGIPLQYL